MVDNLPLTKLYHGAKDGDEDAASQLWKACYVRVVVQARKHLQGVSTRMANEEDVALAAIQNFLRAAKLGRFRDFKDRHDLWRLLFKITRDQAIDLRRLEARRNTRGESALISPVNPHGGAHDIPSGPSKDAFHTAISEMLEHHLELLNPELCEYAVAKLEGFTNQEIADQFGVSVSTVENKLQRIRQIWRKAP